MKLNKQSYALGLLTVIACYVAFLLGIQTKEFINVYIDCRIRTMVMDYKDGIYEDLATLHPDRVHAGLRHGWYVQ